MNLRPILVTPPTVPLVTLAEVKAQCRVDGTANDEVLSLLITAATAYLDGYAGILGRCMRSQVWREEFTGWGTLSLALPDVSAVVVTGLDEAGGTLAATNAELKSDGLGAFVETEGPAAAARVRVDYTCEMPAAQISLAKQAALLLVSHWFDNRGIVGVVSGQLPYAFEAIIAPLRWRHV